MLQRSLSIPVTMRAVVTRGRGQARQLPQQEGDLSVGGAGMGGSMQPGPGVGELDGKGGAGAGLGEGGRFRVDSGRGGLAGSLGTPAVCSPGRNRQEGGLDELGEGLHRVGGGAGEGHAPSSPFRHPSSLQQASGRKLEPQVV